MDDYIDDRRHPPEAVVLLVEDNQSLLDGIRDLLEVGDIGYTLQVITATDGAAGLQAMKETTPDLIISDIMMPRMNGFQFLTEIRQNPDWVHIPLIFLTAKGKEEDIIEGRLSGAELYITKPFKSNELLELLKGQLDRTFALQRARQNNLETLKQNILQILNHEFRTPLTYVTAYYEMLAASVTNFDQDEDLEAYLRGMQAGCIRLSHLVDDLIKVVELRTGEISSQHENKARTIPDIGRLLHQVGLDYEDEMAERGIRLQVDIPEQSPPIYGDPDSLREVLNRLLSNAIKFTGGKRGGHKEIALTMTVRNGEIRLAICDTGIGFPEHVRGQIFEPFFQYNRTLLEQQGSGSGLTIAQGLVELHQGRIEAESIDGKGSTFTVILPIQTAGEAPLQPQPRSDGQRQATILVVEDDRYLLDGLKEILELVDDQYRFRVLTASNGRKGLQVLEHTQPDLIISDIMMPQMDGYEFLNQVRQNPDWLHIPFIFLTAKGERQDRHRGLRSGVAEYITKPYDSDYLIELVITQLNRHFQVQGVVNQSFNDLKRSILELLQPDFRLPLSSVTNHSEKLARSLQGAQTDEDLMNSLRGIQASSRYLSQLVEDFITLAEIKTGQARSAYERHATPMNDPGMLLLDAMLARQAAARQAGVEIHYSHTPDHSPVLCYVTKFHNSLERLIDIALHFSKIGEGQNIFLAVAETESEIHFIIRNTGAGFPDEATVKLRELFAGKRDEVLELPEHGPGLTIIREVVNMHSGRIQLDNDEETGFTFTVSLPVFEPIS